MFYFTLREKLKFSENYIWRHNYNERVLSFVGKNKLNCQTRILLLSGGFKFTIF